MSLIVAKTYTPQNLLFIKLLPIFLKRYQFNSDVFSFIQPFSSSFLECTVFDQDVKDVINLTSDLVENLDQYGDYEISIYIELVDIVIATLENQSIVGCKRIYGGHDIVTTVMYIDRIISHFK